MHSLGPALCRPIALRSPAKAKAWPNPGACSVSSLLCLSVSLAWLRFGREAVSLGRLLLSPAYALAKLPLYGSFFWRRQLAWIRTKRDEK